MFRFASSIFVIFVASLILSWAHPGHDHQHEAAERLEYMRHNTRSLAYCAAKLKSRGHEASNLKRRQDLANELRRSHGLESHPFLGDRDLDSVLGKSHRSENASISLETAPQNLFSDNTSCILQPEVTEGPYYITGELIRKNITDGEAGIPLTVDMQFIDVTTCEPVRDVYVDIWHCNATGVYSGVVANGNGNPKDLGNLENTAFRGLQKTDEMGIAQFNTIFPGHYAGRANHIHLLTHHENDTTFYKNNTLSGLVASHVGQLFFDQNLQAKVEAYKPYSSNAQALTMNVEDGILASEADTSDPIMEYVFLGRHVSDGILGWISIGIDPTETSMVSAKERYCKEGGAEKGGCDFLGS